MKSSRYLIVGGDDRLAELAGLLQMDGLAVSTYGFDRTETAGVKNHTSLEEALESSDIIIGPVPFTKEVYKVNTKYSSFDIEVEELFKKLGKEKKLLLGAINKHSRELAAKYGIAYMDYYNDEGYQIQNTIPTAEGALSIIINETRETVFGSKVLVLGYGRIGKLLSEYLKALRAEVYVEARRDSDLTWINTLGMKPVPIDALQQYLGRMDVIVNTVPAMMLDCRMLELVREDAFILDLASTPGGVDFGYAAQKGIKAVHALGIPGKVASRSAAIYIRDTIMKILLEDKGEEHRVI